MSEPQRYINVSQGLVKDDEGVWIRFADYESLQQENAALKESLKDYKTACEQKQELLYAAQVELKAVKAENESLCESFDGIKNVLHQSPVAWVTQNDWGLPELKWNRLHKLQYHCTVVKQPDIPLYLAAPERPIMCKVCGNKGEFVYLNDKGELP